jgi:hypothetical protein
MLPPALAAHKAIMKPPFIAQTKLKHPPMIAAMIRGISQYLLA